MSAAVVVSRGCSPVAEHAAGDGLSFLREYRL